jgi:hypothetical protein
MKSGLRRSAELDPPIDPTALLNYLDTKTITVLPGR